MLLNKTHFLFFYDIGIVILTGRFICLLKRFLFSVYINTPLSFKVAQRGSEGF